MGKIGWLDNNLKTIWVVCGECQRRKREPGNKDHWVKAGSMSAIKNAIKRNGAYSLACSLGHDIEIDTIYFLRKGLHPK